MAISTGISSFNPYTSSGGHSFILVFYLRKQISTVRDLTKVTQIEAVTMKLTPGQLNGSSQSWGEYE